MRVERGRRGRCRARHDRPVDQREERQLVAREVEPDRLAGFERGALREEQRQALQAGLADVVDLGVAGDDIGEPRLEGRPSWRSRRRPGSGAVRCACAGGVAGRASASARMHATPRSARGTPARSASSPRRAGAASAGTARRRARTPPARRARAAPARRGTPARAGPAARRADRPRAAPCSGA